MKEHSKKTHDDEEEQQDDDGEEYSPHHTSDIESDLDLLDQSWILTFLSWTYYCKKRNEDETEAKVVQWEIVCDMKRKNDLLGVGWSNRDICEEEEDDDDSHGWSGEELEEIDMSSL